MRLGHHDDFEIESIIERIRAVVLRQPGHNVRVAADTLHIPATDLARLLDKGDRVRDRALVIDVIAALVHEAAVDPHWLLTGEYDGAMHRQVLLLGEDRSAKGRSVVRDLVEQQYRRLRRTAWLTWRPWRQGAPSEQPKPMRRVKSA